MESKKVYEAINAVQKALAAEGISKSRKNAQQGYSFRGIDDIYNVVSPMLGQHGLCILPRVTSRECTERQTAKGTALFYVNCQVEFDFVAAADGSKHTVVTWGEAMDSADKATNKAMSAAYKYAVMQAFAIPTEGDNDADATTHEPIHCLPDSVIADYLASFSCATSRAELKASFDLAADAAKRANDKAAYDKFKQAVNAVLQTLPMEQ